MHARDIPETSIVALTTPERADLFRSVLGAGADLRFDPHESEALCEFIFAAAANGCQLLVLDEAHFIHASDMANGVQAFVDDPRAQAACPAIVLVCSQREAGDWLLAFYATYCGIYDIVYACEGGELAATLADVVAHPRQRGDAVHLIRREQHEGPVSVTVAQEPGAGEKPDTFPYEAQDFLLGSGSVRGEVQNSPGEITINIKIEIPY